MCSRVMSPHHPRQNPLLELEGPTLVHDRASLDLSFSDEITLMDDLPEPTPQAAVMVILEDEESFLTEGLVDDGLTTEDERSPSLDSAELRFLADNGLQGLSGLDEDDEDDDEEETLFMNRKVVEAVFNKSKAEPPALPLPLLCRADEQSWLERLPAESRQVLEKARRPMPQWPKANRVDAAVARPVKRIPSLRA